MIKNFLITTFRNLYKQKGFFFINVSGLAIGLTSFIFIALYVQHETNYDRFHSEYKNIYRVKVVGQMSGQELNQAITASPMAQALLEDIPEVEQVCRIGKFGDWLIGYQDKTFNETNLLFADSSFFKMFDFKLIEGNPDDILTEPRSIIMSETYAKKYFGDEDPIGRNLTIESDTVFYTVKGIVEDAPENSHFHYDMIASMVTLKNSRSKQWVSHSHYTYILLRDGTSLEIVEEKMEAFIDKYVGPQLKQIIGISIVEFNEMGNSFGYKLQALEDIHLKSNIQEEIEPNGNLSYVIIFSIIALSILVIAIINFVNLSTAKSSSRAKEVGIKKTLGASKYSLIYQFIGESLLLTFLASLISCFFVSILHPNFIQFTGKEMPLFFFDDPMGILFLVGLTLGVGILAGVYPAFILASYRPVKVLKGNLRGGAKSGWIRSILVVVQFTISISIIIGTLLINNQLTYMQNKELGFNKEHLLIVKRPDALKTKIEIFKQELLQNSNIFSVANSRSIPGKNYSNNGVLKEDDAEKNTFLLYQNWASFEYAEALGLKIVKGRYFSREYGTDSSAVVINEAAVKLLGYGDDPIGKVLLQPGGTDGQMSKHQIIGVVKNFNFESLHKPVGPTCLSIMPGNWEGYLIIRMNSSNIPASIKFVEETWASYTNGRPFQHYFFDQEFNNLYQEERKTAEIFTIFSIIAVFLACLGLLGLVTYASAVRTKEIGIRKVHGASVSTIIRLLSSEVLRLTLVSTIFAWPIAYFSMQKWLEGFADHIDINPLTFVFATFITLSIGWLAISYQAIKVALRNPVEALRHE
ncbi:MAG: FtsX-like permease family protein [Bacteroidetes bacterium]|nr:FtsX-like permease family protein [Bacteroidota bacterium]